MHIYCFLLFSIVMLSLVMYNYLHKAAVMLLQWPVFKAKEESGDVFPVAEPLSSYVGLHRKPKNCALADNHTVELTLRSCNLSRRVTRSTPSHFFKVEVLQKILVWPKYKCWMLLCWTTRVRLEIRFSLKLHLSAWRTCQKVSVVFVLLVLL